MTESHHGDATLMQDVFEGAMAVVIKVHGEKLMMSDREFRDLLLCAHDLFPSAFQWSPDVSYKTVGNERAADDGDPAATLPADVDGYRMCQRCRTQPAVNGPWCKGSCEQLDRGNEETWWRKAVGQ